MARVMNDPYSWYSTVPCAKPGTICDGIDELGMPAKFRLALHVNSVTVVKGHCAVLAAVPTDGTFKVTNDVSGGTVTPLAGPIAAGSYCCVVPAGGTYYCWILVQGWETNLLGDGSVGVGEAITGKAADGTWDTATGTIPVSGYAVSDDTGSPTVFTGYVNTI